MIILLYPYSMEKLVNVDKAQTFYHVLNCSRLSTPDQIKTEYKLLALSLHPDKHALMKDQPGTQSESEELKTKFLQVEEAKRVLLDPELRKGYDVWLDCGLCITYGQWCEVSQRKQNMHWGRAEDRVPRVMEESGRQGESARQSQGWTSHSDPTIDAFRKGKF